MRLSELYSILVLKMGIDPGYVLDRMEIYEIQALMDHQDYRERDEWEQARMISLIMAQCHSSKKLKAQDILEFPWEVEARKERQKAATEEEASRIEAKMQAFIDMGVV